MRNLVKNQSGLVYVGVIYISLIIITILASLLHLMNNNIIADTSNSYNYKANYIAESLLELNIMEINEISDKVIKEYLTDLKGYKSEYIRLVQNDPSVIYDPPLFSKYISQSFIPIIKQLSGTTNRPFEEYEDNHYFKIDIKYDSIYNVINIKAEGSYQRARVFINVKLDPPQSVDVGFDEYNLPQIRISSIDIIEYYQSFGI